jgi:hypothetical protein
MAFYGFGVADPTISENVRRARQFAALYIGEDPRAPNYDPRYRVFRSPMQTSQGPHLRAQDVNEVKRWLQGGKGGGPGWIPKPMGVRASLYPVVRELEPDWYENPQRREEIAELFNRIVLTGDVANSLAATGLVTHAYLYTGEEKYRRWVLEYTEAWMERMRRNKGIMPDNVGPTGQIGEQRQGQWWGGLYGWNHYQGFNIMFHGMVVAAECALLLSGDFGYLELIRSQLRALLENAKLGEDGQLLVPARRGPNGWESYRPMRILELAHLYHASLSREDYELFARVREGDRRDWNRVEPEHEKNRQLQDGHQNMARFQYYEGQNPDWPEQLLQAECQMALAAFEVIRAEERDPEALIAANYCPPNPVLTKGLTQLMLGAPQSVYNGGLLRAQVRYFDPERGRPGLPPDTAALVEELKAEETLLHLVNLSPTHTRCLLVQGGAFGEHQLTWARLAEEGEEKAAPGEACRARGIAFAAGDLDRNLPDYWKARQLIDSGELGQVRSISLLYGSGAEISGGGCQILSLMRLFAQDAEVDWAIGWAAGDPFSDEDQGMAGYVRFVNGIECFIHRQDNAKNGVEVLGTQGVFFSDGFFLHLWKAPREVERPTWTALEKVEGVFPRTSIYGTREYDEEGWKWPGDRNMATSSAGASWGWRSSPASSSRTAPRRAASAAAG